MADSPGRAGLEFWKTVGDDGVADDVLALLQPGADGGPARQVVAGPVAHLDGQPFLHRLAPSAGRRRRVDAIGPVPGVVALARELDDGLAGRVVRQDRDGQHLAGGGLHGHVGASALSQPPVGRLAMTGWPFCLAGSPTTRSGQRTR